MLRLVVTFFLGVFWCSHAAELTRQRSFDVAFPTSDLVFDLARERAYLTDPSSNQVVSIDLNTGTSIDRFVFDHRPETLALRPDGSRLYIAMPTRLHDYYWFGAHTGYVGEVNLQVSPAIRRQFVVDVDPFGIIATDQGWLAIPDGSGQWTELVSFNAATGQRLSSRMIRQMSNIRLHPNQVQFYTADTDSSPSDIESWLISSADGSLSGGADSPYHGDYPMNGRVYINPNGSNLVTAGGTVLTSSTIPEQDMRFIVSLRNGSVSAAVFDPAHKSLFTANVQGVLSHYGPDFQFVRQYSIGTGARYLATVSNLLVVAYQRADRTSFEFFDNPALGAETNTPPVPNFVWTPEFPTTTNLITLDASTTTDDQARTNLLYSWDFEADGTWEVHYTDNPVATVRYPTGGTKTIRLEVIDGFGVSARIEKAVNVPFVVDPGIPGGSNPAFELLFSATDIAVDATRPRLFATHSAEKKLVVLNLTNGFVEREFSFVHTPEHIAISPNGSNLFVTLVTRPHSAYWFSAHTGYVAQISLGSLAKVGEVRVDVDPYDIVATDNGILGISGGSDQWTEIVTVESASGRILGRIGAYMGGLLALHPSQTAIYYGDQGLSPADFDRINFDPQTGVILSAWDSPYHGDYSLGGKPLLSPDGRYVLGSAGVLLDLRYVNSLLRFRGAFFDTENHALFTVGEGELHYYDNQFQRMRTDNVNASANYVFGNGTNLWLVARTENRTTIYPRLNPSGAARNNVPPVVTIIETNRVSQLGRLFGISVKASIVDEYPGSVQVRWDFEADGQYETSFTTNLSATYFYGFPGVHTIRVQAKDEFNAVSVSEMTVDVTRGAYAGVDLEPGAHPPFEFAAPLRLAVFHPTRPLLFGVPDGTQNVVLINLESGYATRLWSYNHFPAIRAESVTIRPDGKRLFVAFSGTAPEIDRESGFIAEFDLDAMVLTYEHSLPTVIKDIVATDSGFVVASDGFGGTRTGNVINTLTGQRTLFSLPGEVYLSLPPGQEFVYASHTEDTGGGMYINTLYSYQLASDGQVTEHGSSFRNGGSLEGRDLSVLPDGSAVLAHTGALYLTSTNPATDLKDFHLVDVAHFGSVVFDTNRHLLAAARGTNITFVSYDTNSFRDTRNYPGAVMIGQSSNRIGVIVSTSGQSRISFLTFPASNADENQSPTVTLTAAELPSPLNAGRTIALLARGTDLDGTIQNLRIVADAAEWSTNAVTLEVSALVHPGTNTFYAVATDNFNVSSTSSVLQVWGNMVPNISFAQPSTNNVVISNPFGALFATADASDPDGSIALVRLWANGKQVATVTAAPYTFSYRPNILGVYTLQLEAVDNDGASSFSQSLTVRFEQFNDNFSTELIPILTGTNYSFNVSTVRATRQKGEPFHGGFPGGRSVWWAWRAPEAPVGTLTLDTRGSDFDTLLAVYTLTNQPFQASVTNLLLVAQNDDDSGIAPASRVKFTPERNRVYYIAVDGRDGVGGDATLNLRFAPGTGPRNDMLALANIASVGGSLLVSSNAGGTKEIGEPNHAGNRGGASVWWRFTSASASPIKISTAGSSFDTLLAIYTNSAPSTPASIPTMQSIRLIASNDDAPDGSRTSELIFTQRTAGPFWVAVDGYDGAEGVIRLAITRLPNSPPLNDAFGNAAILFGAATVTNVNTSFATLEAGEPLHSQSINGGSVWYRWSPNADGPVYLSTKGSDFDTVLTAFTGEVLANLTLVASNDDDPASLGSSALAFDASLGTEYSIAISGYNRASGNAVLSLNQIPLLIPHLAAAWSAGRITVAVSGVTVPMVVETSTDLVHWEPLNNVFIGDIALEVVPNWAGPQQFYRVRGL